MAKYITVQAVGKPNTTILWEKNKEHPHGEVFLKPGDVAQVARTPAVNERLRKGTLVLATEQAEAKTTEGQTDDEDEDDEEEGADKPEIGASTIMTTATGPVANAVAGPETGAGVGPARGRTAAKK